VQILATSQNTGFVDTSQEINGSFCLNLDTYLEILSIIIEFSTKLSHDPIQTIREPNLGRELRMEITA
jgi:hypothetical protein